MSLKRPRIVIFFGGQEDNHDLSQETGYWLCQYAPRSRYDITPVHITPTGQWQVPLGTLPRQGPIDRMVQLLFKTVRPLKPAKALERLLHTPVHALLTTVRGQGGDDGSLASLGHALELPVVGSSAATCQQTYHKQLAAAQLDDIVSSPVSLTFKAATPLDDVVTDVTDQLAFPVFVKPTSAEGSTGVAVAEDAGELRRLVQRLAPLGNFLVQEKAAGSEVTLTLVPDERGKLTMLPPTVIVPGRAAFYDRLAKRRPGRVTLHTNSQERNPLIWEAEVIAREIYEELGCQGAASIDLVAGEQGTKLLEVNTVPTLTRATPFTQQLAQAHLHPTKMIDNLLRQSL